MAKIKDKEGQGFCVKEDNARKLMQGFGAWALMYNLNDL